MKIAIACDHGALDLKNALIAYLESKNYEVVNFGTDTLDSCDYPDYCGAAAKAVADGRCDRGIVLCTTGIGASIAANKIRGIRCALLSDLMSARLTREHNDTNVLAFEIVDTWLETEFSGGERHARRIDKVMALEK